MHKSCKLAPQNNHVENNMEPRQQTSKLPYRLKFHYNEINLFYKVKITVKHIKVGKIKQNVILSQQWYNYNITKSPDMLHDITSPILSIFRTILYIKKQHVVTF